MNNILEFASEEDREEFINEFRHQADMIKDLQKKLALTEKALELSCKELRDNFCINCDEKTKCLRKEMCEMVLNTYLPSDFKEQAEKELKGE